MPRRKVNQKVFAELYRAGMPMDRICRYFGGVARSTLKMNRQQLKLKPRPKGWKPAKKWRTAAEQQGNGRA